MLVRNLLLALLLLASPLSAQVTITGMTLAGVAFALMLLVEHLVAWFDGDTGVTAGATFTWADQSGNGNDVTQSTANLQPSIVTTCQISLDCVYFDDDSSEIDYLSGAEWGLNLNTSGVTLFIVFDALTSASSNDFMLGQADGTGQGRNWVDIEGVGDNLATWIGGSALSGSSTISTSTTYIGTIAVGSGTTAAVDIYVNGGADESAATATAEAANGNMIIGSARDGLQSDPHNIMEICVYGSVLDATNRAAVRDALNTKWSVY